jgi:hypothetical protein
MSETFDPENAVATYREVMAQLEAQATDLGRDEFRAIALRLRQQWTEWQGEDSLHEMAFGEPASEA